MLNNFNKTIIHLMHGLKFYNVIEEGFHCKEKNPDEFLKYLKTENDTKIRGIKLASNKIIHSKENEKGYLETRELWLKDSGRLFITEFIVNSKYNNGDWVNVCTKRKIIEDDIKIKDIDGMVANFDSNEIRLNLNKYLEKRTIDLEKRLEKQKRLVDYCNNI